MKGVWRIKGYFYNSYGIEYVVTHYNLSHRQLMRKVKEMYKYDAFKVETAKTGGG